MKRHVRKLKGPVQFQNLIIKSEHGLNELQLVGNKFHSDFIVPRFLSLVAATVRTPSMGLCVFESLSSLISFVIIGQWLGLSGPLLTHL